MALNKVELCGVNTSKLPLLNEEEKEALFARIKEGDQEARDTYIKGNLRLVLSVIKRFSARSTCPPEYGAKAGQPISFVTSSAK